MFFAFLLVLMIAVIGHIPKRFNLCKDNVVIGGMGFFQDTDNHEALRVQIGFACRMAGINDIADLKGIVFCDV